MTSTFFTFLPARPCIRLALGAILLCAHGFLYGQCSNDTVPPVAICVSQAFVNILFDDPNDCFGPAGPNGVPSPSPGAGISWVQASMLDEGSFDACNNIHLAVRRSTPYSACINALNAVNGTAPCDDLSADTPNEFERATQESDSIKFYACEVGTTQDVILRVYQTDAAGNIMTNGGVPIYNECTINVVVQDKVKPVVLCPANVTVACENFDPSLLAYGDVTALDNVCLDTVLKTLNYDLFDTVCNRGTIVRTYQAIDCSGNLAQCTHRIIVNYEQDYFIRFPNDLVLASPNGGNYGSPVFFGEDCELLQLNYQDVILTNDPDADIRIERTWTIINGCSYVPGQPVVIVPNPDPFPDWDNPGNQPGPTVSASGAPAPWNPTISKITPLDTATTDFSTFYDPNANGYSYTQIIRIFDPMQAILTGKVFLDTLVDCTFNSGEPLLSNWKVKATGLVSNEVVEGFTNANGEYTLLLPAADTLAEVTLAVSINFGQGCPSVFTVPLASGQTSVQDIPAHLESNCPQLSVDLSTPFLRRCFNNTYYVNACNLGTEVVENTHVEVALDPYLDFQYSDIPATPMGNNSFSFATGDLNPGACTSFLIITNLSCAAQLGYTHCSTAHIYPDTLCPTPLGWSGADIEVTGFCDGDSVRFTLANVGISDMPQVQDFVVVEDVVMYMTAPFQLNSGQSQMYAAPANGATWRMATPEVPNHPWGGVEAAVVEGCGGLNNPGLVNIFSLNTSNPFESVDCQENIGSFDPNDKQAFPKGYGTQHLVEANTDLEYLIRFQNSGTDTAFTVVILDTLSGYVEASSVQPGASSHHYDFAVLDGNVLRFQFDNILLPDSNINEAASHGFVKYRVSQKADNPDGSLIENRAAIFFDFNDPVMTNTTFHTIGDQFILVKTDEKNNGTGLNAYPNPARGTVTFEFPVPVRNASFELTGSLGRLVHLEKFAGTRYLFERGNLPAGVYFYRINGENGALFTGKIILR